MDRRSFLAGLGATSLAAAFSTGKVNGLNAKGRVLFLGGRDFLGPTIVTELLGQGYDVTLFNRGQTNPHLFPNLTWVSGDREIFDGSGMENLVTHIKTNRYDWVIDTWQKTPKAVEISVDLLKHYVAHYQYTSSIAVYSRWQQVGQNEDTPTRDLEALGRPLDELMTATDLGYSNRKTLSEAIIMSGYGGQALCVRAHGIRSDRIPDPTDEPYWPVRLSRGGEVLLPDVDNHLMQVTDALSLTRFMIKCGARRIGGNFNVAYEPMTFRDYVRSAGAALDASYTPVWIEGEFLKANGLQPYQDIPLWRPDPPGFYTIDVSMALDAGLANRPIGDMAIDQLAGYRRRYPHDDFMFGGHGTIAPSLEKEIIRRWREGMS